MPTDIPIGTLRKNALGVPQIVFFVIAAAAPLTAVVGVTPAAFMLGNGPGVPATFFLVGVLYLLFSVGFTAMSVFIGSAGGFYAYIVAGLGPAVGVAGAMIALATYAAVELGTFGLFGFFLNEMVTSHGGPAVAWWNYSAVLAVVVHACGRRSIQFSGAVLACCLVAEVIILLLLDLSILLTAGPARPIVLAPFGPHALIAPGLGMALVFVVTAFIGFEATAIFGEEARDRERTITRATYISVILIAVFYAFTTWSIALFYGPEHIKEAAAQHTATLYLTAAISQLGKTAGYAMEGLLLASLFACVLSFHNTLNRYLFAVGREGLLWRPLGRTHRHHYSPHVAGVVQTATMLGLLALFALAGSDPYAVVFAWMGTLASLGILLLQAMVSLSVIAYFQRDGRRTSVWRHVLAPGLSAIGLALCFILMAANLELVSGSNSPVVQTFPGLLLVIGLGGAFLAGWIRVRKPDVYQDLGRALPSDALKSP